MTVSVADRTIEIANIPAELGGYNQWVAWRWEAREGKPTKVPVSVSDEAAFFRSDASLLYRASSTNPAHWLSFNHATAALINSTLAGIGFVVTKDDPFCGVDLDHCWTEDGWTQSAQEIVEKLNSYTEVTPSGEGLRVWIRGELPPDGRKRNSQIEVYDSGRFFTVTGRRLNDLPGTIQFRQNELETLHRDLFPRAPVAPARPTAAIPKSDKELAEKMFSAKNGDAIRRLFDGDTAGYGSQSEADLALVSHLWYWTGGDASRTDALFRQSGLMRPKWDDRRGDHSYGQETIKRASNG